MQLVRWFAFGVWVLPVMVLLVGIVRAVPVWDAIYWTLVSMLVAEAAFIAVTAVVAAITVRRIRGLSRTNGPTDAGDGGGRPA